MLEPLLAENGDKLEVVTFECGDIPFEDGPAVLSNREELDREFYPGYGGIRVRPFRGYTKNSIYFAYDYDSQVTICHLPRHHGSGRMALHYGRNPGYLYR